MGLCCWHITFLCVQADTVLKQMQHVQAQLPFLPGQAAACLDAVPGQPRLAAVSRTPSGSEAADFQLAILDVETLAWLDSVEPGAMTSLAGPLNMGEHTFMRAVLGLTAVLHLVTRSLLQGRCWRGRAALTCWRWQPAQLRRPRATQSCWA